MLTHRTDFVRLSHWTLTQNAMRLLPEQAARELGAAPLWLEGDQLVIASANADDAQAVMALKRAVRGPVRTLSATYADIRALLDRGYRREVGTPAPLTLEQTLLALGHVGADQLGRVRAERAAQDESLAQACLRLGLCRPEALFEAAAWQWQIPFLPLKGLTPRTELASLIPWEVARARHVLPLWLFRNTLIAGITLPAEAPDFADLESRLGLNILPVLCNPAEFNPLYERMYLSGTDPVDDGAVVQALVRQGVLSGDTLAGSATVARQTGKTVPQVLLEREIVTPPQWLGAESQLYGIPVYRPRKPGLLAPAGLNGHGSIPAPLARVLAVVPLEYDSSHKTLIVGVRRSQQATMQVMQSLTGLAVEPRLISSAELDERLAAVESARPEPRVATSPRMSDLLVGIGLLTAAQLDQVTRGEDLPDAELGDRLIGAGLLDETDWGRAHSLRTGVPFARLDNARFERACIERIPARVLQDHRMLPLLQQGRDLWLAVADPADAAGMQAVEQVTGLQVWPVLAPRSVVAAAQHLHLGAQARALQAPARNLVDRLLRDRVLTQSGAVKAIELVSEGTPVDRAIVQASGQPETAMAPILAAMANVPLVSLQLEEEAAARFDALGRPVKRTVVHDPVAAAAARLVDRKTAQRLGALPIRRDTQLTVAFADPLFETARQEIENLLGERVRPCLAMRSDLEAAIQRLLGHQNIGTRLLLAGVITRAQLNDALDLSDRTGVRLGRALVDRGYVTQAQLSRFLAEQAQLPFFELTGVELDSAAGRLVDPATARAYGILPLAADDAQVLLAMVDPLSDEARQAAAKMTERPIRPVLVSETDLESALERLYCDDYLAQSVSQLLQRSPDDSAYHVLSRTQKIGLVVFGLVSLAALLVDYRAYLLFLNALSTIFYLAFSTYKFYLVYHALTGNLEVPVTDADLAVLQDRDLPIYTILVPVYREAEVLPDLLRAIAKLDYPTTKLDIKILMEADDAATLQAFADLKMPAHFQGVVVPTAQPKTKPKACNYGLIHARGDYVVIFDAEDLPDPDQLKRVIVAFDKSAPEVVCIQSKLNYYNRNQNLLTAWFTVEYSMWFDLFLPGLDASRAPIPLGGTSNHFKRAALVEAGAWDPHNVTEDADLGIRIFKRGYRTAVVDSTTYEEANSRLFNWIRQRSRWIKGYIQTWLVHMRHPLRLYREVGGKSFWAFQLVIGGTFFAALLNPVYWILTTLWFFTKWGLIQEIFPGIVFYAGAFCLYVGNFAFMYMNVAGAMRRGYYDIVKIALLSPLYWGLMSVAAWKGLLQLITKPHFWEKTEHGFFQGAPSTERADRLKDLV